MVIYQNMIRIYHCRAIKTENRPQKRGLLFRDPSGKDESVKYLVSNG